ncbi:signal peptidase II [Georgenia yuyongxinii]|uniref:Lipoprotein signal peptidase n=1 Tax=Georgenia yuyongxinii TaxID=2589797 RepID=A0A5B8C171_9MICO|nr:signal peptidase II [Georgenia yuyongxinii]QDC24343.1 signal peptidase II [Georgenia yuyongxinii]
MDNQPASPPVAPARRRRRLVLLVVLTVAIAVVDQATKYLAEARLTRGEVTPLLGDLLGLQLIYNPGAAFSLATGMTWIFTIVSVVVIVVVARIARRLGSAWWAVALGMLLGGCLGNLYDRLFREPGFPEGHVVDFISYGGYFIGNVADIAIVGAAILIALLAVRGREVDGSLAAHRHETEPAANGAEAAAGRGTHDA